MNDAPTLTALDIACGAPFGAWRGVARLPAPSAGVIEALERAVLPALRRGPCLVSFSGGRDSSLVLAAAARVARREGLRDPIPATNRFRGAPASDERSYQELTVSHLGLSDWVRLEHDDELDLVGPYAARALRAHGLLWPFNVHFHLPLLDAARGGSLLTGIGGDELFGAAGAPDPLRWRARALRALPPAVRAAREARRHPVDFPWLRPAGRRAASRIVAANRVRLPRAPLPRLEWARRQRYFGQGIEALAAPAGDADVAIAHPLADAGLWSAVGAAAPRGGFASRTAAMRTLFGELLPDEVLARRTKASFDEAFFAGPSQEFAARWDGSGVPVELVDVGALREHWAGGAPMANSYTLLQAAWLSAAGEAGEELADGRQRSGVAGPPQAPHRP